MAKLTSAPKYLPSQKANVKSKPNNFRKLYGKNNADRWTYVEPISESRTRVDGTIVRNTDRNQVILLTLSDRKPRVSTFFKKEQPRTVLRFKEEYDLRNVRVATWAMLVILHNYSKIVTELSGEAKK